MMCLDFVGFYEAYSLSVALNLRLPVVVVAAEEKSLSSSIYEL